VLADAADRPGPGRRDPVDGLEASALPPPALGGGPVRSARRVALDRLERAARLGVTRDARLRRQAAQPATAGLPGPADDGGASRSLLGGAAPARGADVSRVSPADRALRLRRGQDVADERGAALHRAAPLPA